MNNITKIRPKFHINSIINDKFINVKARLQCTKHTTEFDSPAYKEPNQVKSLFKFWQKSFSKYHIPEPTESIEHILAFSLGSTKISDVYTNFETILELEKAQEVNKLCFLRLKRMPVQYIIKEWDFRDLTLKMKPPVFIPRPETEMLIDIIAKDIQSDQNLNILEVCCGSGAISLAILKTLPKAKVTAIDASKDACELTKENAILHGLEQKISIINSSISEHNLLANINDTFDVIISNPPYVLDKDMDTLEPEIKNFEDLKALNGGPDGLNIIEPIIQMAAEKLSSNGTLYLEVDPTHPKLIENYIESNFQNVLCFVQTYQDFCKKDRFVKIRKISKQ